MRGRAMVRLLVLLPLLLMLAATPLLAGCAAEEETPTPTPTTPTPTPTTPTPTPTTPTPTPTTPTPTPTTPTPTPTEVVSGEVVFVTSADFTGATATLSSGAVYGADDFWHFLNEDHGGIVAVKGDTTYKIKVRTINIDSRYDPARGISIYRKYRDEPNFVFFLSHQTPTTKALHPLMRADRMPNSTPGEGENQGKLIGYTVTFTPAYQDMFGAFIDMALEDWEARGETGKPVIGFIGWDNAYGHEATLGGLEYAESKGVEVLPGEYFPIGTPDHSVYLNRLAEGGADYVYMAAPDPTGPAVIRDAHALGLTEDIQFCGDIWSFAGPGLKLYPPEMLEGAWILGSFLRGPEARASVAGKQYERAGRGDAAGMTELYNVGYYSAMLVSAAVQKALETVGYEELTPQSVWEGLISLPEGLTEYEAEPGVVYHNDVNPGMTIREDERRACRWVKWYRIHNGEFEALDPEARGEPTKGWVMTPDTVAMHEWD